LEPESKWMEVVHMYASSSPSFFAVGQLNLDLAFLTILKVVIVSVRNTFDLEYFKRNALSPLTSWKFIITLLVLAAHFTDETVYNISLSTSDCEAPLEADALFQSIDKELFQFFTKYMVV